MAKRGASKGAKPSAATAAADLLEADPPANDTSDLREDDRPTLNEVLGIDDEQEPIPFNDLDPETQAAYVDSLRAEGREEDADIAQSRINAQRRRQGMRTAELIRLEPDEDEEGIPIAGVIRTFTPPFNDLSIRQWALRHCGGGKFEISYYGANHQWLTRERFKLPGMPNAWRKQHALEQEDNKKTREKTDVEIGAAPSDREARLESELAELRQMLVSNERRRAEETKDKQHRDEIERLERKIEAMATKKESNLPELITALGAAVAPVMEALSSRMSHSEDRRGEVKELMGEMRRTAEDSRKQVMDIMALSNKKPSAMEDAMGKLVNTIMLERLKPAQDPQSFAFDMLRKVIPQAVNSSLEMAQAAQQGGGSDSMIERVFEMVGPLVERALPGMRGGQPAMPQGAMPAMPMAMPGYGYPQLPYRTPMQPAMPAPAPMMAQPQPGQWPYTQTTPIQGGGPQPMAPSQQQPMGGMPQPYPQQGQPMPPQPGPAGYPPSTPATPGMPVQAPQVPQVPQAPGMAPGMGQVPVGYPMPGLPSGGAGGVVTREAPRDQTNAIGAYIDPNLFVLVRTYLQNGKTGDELAEAVDDQIESVRRGQQQGAPLLSEDALEYLESYPPELIIMKLWDACPPEMLHEFRGPDGSTWPAVREFVLEFMHYYYDNDEEEAEEANAAFASGQAPGPIPLQPMPAAPQPPAPAPPSTEGA